MRILVRLGEAAAIFAVLVAAVPFAFEYQDRARQAYYETWGAIHESHGQSGSLARLQAMEYLNEHGESLSGVEAPSAKLSGVDLLNADLSEANLSGADLYGADLRGTDLSRASLQGASLRCADLREAKMSQEQIDAARGDTTTKLPDKVTGWNGSVEDRKGPKYADLPSEEDRWWEASSAEVEDCSRYWSGVQRGN